MFLLENQVSPHLLNSWSSLKISNKVRIKHQKFAPNHLVASIMFRPSIHSDLNYPNFLLKSKGKRRECLFLCFLFWNATRGSFFFTYYTREQWYAVSKLVQNNYLHTINWEIWYFVYFCFRGIYKVLHSDDFSNFFNFFTNLIIYNALFSIWVGSWTSCFKWTTFPWLNTFVRTTISMNITITLLPLALAIQTITALLATLPCTSVLQTEPVTVHFFVLCKHCDFFRWLSWPPIRSAADRD